MNLKRLLENYQDDYKLYEYLVSLDLVLLYHDLVEYGIRLSEYLAFLQSGVFTERVIQKLIDLNDDDYKFFDYLWNQRLDLDIDKWKLKDWEGRLLESGFILDTELVKCELQNVSEFANFDEFKVKTNGRFY